MSTKDNLQDVNKQLKCLCGLHCSGQYLGECLSEKGVSCLAFIQSPIDQALSESSDS